MALCIISKCRGGGFLCGGTFLHSQERRNEDGGAAGKGLRD